jgi:hypothetical protein
MAVKDIPGGHPSADDSGNPEYLHGAPPQTDPPGGRPAQTSNTTHTIF